MTEFINSKLFVFRYKRLPQTTNSVLEEIEKEGFKYSVVSFEDVDSLIGFRERQNEEYVSYFNPHPFDRQSIIRMLENKAYSLMKIEDAESGEIVGYFFLRCFFMGKAFHGLITDARYAGRGLGSSMWKTSMEICHRMGLRMFATVSVKNRASLKSAESGTEVKIVKNLPNDYYLIQCQPNSQK